MRHLALCLVAASALAACIVTLPAGAATMSRVPEAASFTGGQAPVMPLSGADASSAWDGAIPDVRPPYSLPINRDLGFDYFEKQSHAQPHAGMASTILRGSGIGAATGARMVHDLRSGDFARGPRRATYYVKGFGPIRTGKRLARRLYRLGPESRPRPPYLLLGVGLIGLFGYAWRRRRA